MKKQFKELLIHIVQVLALLIFGLAIYSQQTLTDFGLGHGLAMQVSFWGLLLSLGYEHFRMK